MQCGSARTMRWLRMRIRGEAPRTANGLSDMSGRSSRAISSNVLRLQFLPNVYRAHSDQQDGVSDLQRSEF